MGGDIGVGTPRDHVSTLQLQLMAAREVVVRARKKALDRAGRIEPDLLEGLDTSDELLQMRARLKARGK